MERSARALGGSASAWLDELPQLVAELSKAWDIQVGATLHGGSSSYVAEAVTADGTPAVLKITMPGEEPVDGEIRALALADGQGFARLLAADPSRRALLVERLGEPLAARNLPADEQIEVLVETLVSAWRPVPDARNVATLPEKAAWLMGFIPQTWEALGRPCSQALVDRALTCAQDRAAEWSAETSVLLHGDPHSHNALADPAQPGRYRLVDPDGILGERAYDLGILMRGWDEPLLPDPVGLGRARCARLAALGGEPAVAIWAWGLVERTSTALYAWKLGAEAEGHRMLVIAEAWGEASA